jgi:hypothetical protein
MADMTLPFKLLSQPTADTTAQTQKDTRALASGEALQRLKTSGALDVQKQKGADQLRTTLAPLGLDPNSPDISNQLRQLFDATQVGKRAQAVAHAVKGGVRLPKQPGPISLRDPLPGFSTGNVLPGVAMEREKGKYVAKTGKKTTKYRDEKTGKSLSPFAKVEETESQQTTGQARTPTEAKKSVEKTLDVKEYLSKVPPEGVPFVRPNGQVGRLYNVAGRATFIPDPK